VKTTAYFDAIRMRPDRANITDAWIQRAQAAPVSVVTQQDGRKRQWAPIPEMENRYLRVILLEDGETVHNAFFRSQVQTMKVRYFPDTDTLLIELRDVPIAESRDLDENTILDVDTNGNICAITIEHASERADAPHFSYEQVAA
jgi:uncharacterized protein YuzE